MSAGGPKGHISHLREKEGRAGDTITQEQFNIKAREARCCDRQRITGRRREDELRFGWTEDNNSISILFCLFLVVFSSFASIKLLSIYRIEYYIWFLSRQLQ